MGNHISHRPLHASAGRVILPDGTVQKYDQPVTVAELMLDHPQQMVVEFQTVIHGRKPAPLPADTKLESSKVYMMLPMRRGKPAGGLSSEEARQILLRANATSFVSAYTGFLPLFARICPASVVKSKKKVKSPEALKREVFREMEMVMESEARGDYYLSRQLSGKGTWKPSLDTIKEKGVKARIRHWLL